MAYRRVNLDLKPFDLRWVTEVLDLYRPRGLGHYTIVNWDSLVSVIRDPLSDGDEDFVCVCLAAEVKELPYWLERLLRDDSGDADLYQFGDLAVLVKRHA